MSNANSASALVANLSDFPGLSDALQGKGPGDTCKLEVEVRIEELGGDTLRAAIVEVVPEGYQTAPEEPEESKIRESSPMILVLREKNRK